MNATETIATLNTSRAPLRRRRYRLQELTEIRAMHVSVAGHALHEIQNAVPGVMPEPELTIQTR